jgi:hypothetical protein
MASMFGPCFFFSHLKQIPLMNNVIFKDYVCDMCHKSNQTRLCFPNSSNKSLRCFSLIHYDVLGYYQTPSSCGAHYFLSIVDDYLDVHGFTQYVKNLKHLILDVYGFTQYVKNLKHLIFLLYFVIWFKHNTTFQFQPLGVIIEGGVYLS